MPSCQTIGYPIVFTAEKYGDVMLIVRNTNIEEVIRQQNMRISMNPLILFMKRGESYFDLSKYVFQNIRLIVNIPLSSMITRSVVIASSHNASSKNQKEKRP
jgi:hypothetical protein